MKPIRTMHSLWDLHRAAIRRLHSPSVSANGYSSTYAAEVGNDVMEYYYQITPEEELITGTASEIAVSTTGD